MPGEGMDLEPPMTADQVMQKRASGVVTRVRTAEDLSMGFGTTLAEARTLVTYISLSGVVYSVASVMPELPAERVRLLEMTLPTMPILPIDLFSRGSDPKWDTFKHTQPDYYIHNYPEILDLKVNAKAGVYDVVGLTNWRSWPATRDLSFRDKLGLSAEVPYVVFDFWNQKLLGVFRNRMPVAIDPHDTRVFLIHPLSNRPQLIGTSRHITGAYSILDLEWDGLRNRLRGSSATIPGEDYALWVYVPKGMSIAQARARTSKNRVVSVHQNLNGNSLRLSFEGQPDTMNWEVAFVGDGVH